MKVTVKGAVDIEGIKRCYVDTEVKIACPNCDAELTTYLGDNYLSYPVVPGSDTIHFYCIECDENYKNCEFLLPVYLESCEITMSYDPIELKSE